MPYLPDGTPVFEEVWDHLFAPVGGPAPVPVLSVTARWVLVAAIGGLSLRCAGPTVRRLRRRAERAA